jgi:5-methylcytosine-specific restriction endonuclease McrA
LSLLYQGIAKAVDQQYRTFDFDSWGALTASLNDETIHLTDRMFRVPRVILLVAYDRVPKRQVRFSRFNVFARDKNTCQYCGERFPRQELNLDHVIPRSRGGLSTWENVVCSCFTCNRVKGGCLPHEAGMQLIQKPVRPEWTPFMLETFSFKRYQEWLPYLNAVDAAYWNTELLER